MRVQSVKQWLAAGEPGSSLSHFVGLVFAIAGAVVLFVAAGHSQSTLSIVSFVIYGTSLVGLYAASTIYHVVPRSKTKHKSIWHLIDQIMIYALIAGTYTPVALVALRGSWGWSLFGVVWGLATIGIVLRIVPSVPIWITYASYVLLGWLAIVAIVPLVQNFSWGALGWLFAGGLLYTLGTLFEVKKIAAKLPKNIWIGAHEIFHLFVLAGSLSHFALIFKYIA